MIINKFQSFYNYSLRFPDLLKKLRVDSVLRHTLVFLANIFFPCYFVTTRKWKILDKNGTLLHNRRIIVSLTSFPARIGVVWMVVESLMHQTLKPHKIILWLSKEQFSTIESLPKKLLAQRERGLEIRLVDGDIRSHKKYIYAFKEYPNDYVVLVDDDILYPEGFIAELMEGMENNDRINCSYGAIMKYDNNGALLPYNKWPIYVNSKYNGNDFFFGTGGGTVFIPSLMYADTINAELAFKLCPLADDVWLNAMCRLSQIKCIKVRGQLIPPLTIENNQTLCSVNVGQSKNDIQIENVRKYYISILNKDPYGNGI